MTEEVWVSAHTWCPYGSLVRNPDVNPIRVLVEVGHLEHDDRFVPDRAHLLVDVTDARNPKLDISLEELPAERRESYRHPGGGWTRPLESISAARREELRI